MALYRKQGHGLITGVIRYGFKYLTKNNIIFHLKIFETKQSTYFLAERASVTPPSPDVVGMPEWTQFGQNSFNIAQGKLGRISCMHVVNCVIRRILKTVRLRTPEKRVRSSNANRWLDSQTTGWPEKSFVF